MIYPQKEKPYRRLDFPRNLIEILGGEGLGLLLRGFAGGNSPVAHCVSLFFFFLAVQTLGGVNLVNGIVSCQDLPGYVLDRQQSFRWGLALANVIFAD